MEEGWCVRPVLIEAVISDGDGCAIHVAQETPPQDIIVSAAQDRQNLLGLLSEQAPKVNLENQGEKPTKHHEKPKQHTPFCLDYRTGVLESGLSADAELRERKGGWLVRNWPWAAVSRVLAMALYDGINTRVMELAMKTTTRGMIISKGVQTLDKHSRGETPRDSRCQLSPVGGCRPPAGSQFGVQELPGCD